MPRADILGKLQEWYSTQCDGEWEHKYGVEITTCDNPGWWVKIDLIDTPLQVKAFETQVENIDPAGFPTGTQWLNCRIENGVWHGAGDDSKLVAILDCFLS